MKELCMGVLIHRKCLRVLTLSDGIRKPRFVCITAHLGSFPNIEEKHIIKQPLPPNIVTVQLENHPSTYVTIGSYYYIL